MASSEPKDGYSPPIMLVDDIIECVNLNFNMQIKKADLIPGDSDKVIDIYWAILSDFYPNLDTICQPRLFKNVEVTEDMDTLITIRHLFQVLKNVLERLEFHDVLLADLLMPTFKRTQAILSHLLNFWRFTKSASRNEPVAKLTETCLELMAEKDELLAAAPNIERDLNNVETEMFQVRDATDQINEHLQLLKIRFKSRLEAKELLQQHITTMKEEKAKCSQENKELMSNLQELKTRNDKLVEKIVDSPTQIEKKIMARKQAIASLKTDIKTKKMRFNEIIEQAKNYSVFRSKIDSVVAYTKSIKDFIDNHETKKEAVSEIGAKRQAIRENIAETDVAIANCESELKLLNEKIAKLEHQHHIKMSSLRTQLKEAKLSKKKLSKKADHINIALEAALQEYEILTNRMKAAKAKAKATEEEAQTHKETLAALDHYHGILFTYLKDMKAIVERLANRPSIPSVILKMTEEYCDARK